MRTAYVCATAILLTAVAVAVAEQPGDEAQALLAPALQRIGDRDFDGARAYLRELSDRYPNWPAVELYLATTYYEEQRWSSAQRHFDRLLELAPGFHKAQRLSGWCLLYLGEPGAARARFEAYLSQVPGDADAIFGLALVDLDEDRVEAARSGLQTAIELTHRSGDAKREALIRVRLSDLLVRTDELEQARDQLLRSLALDPENAKTWFKLSRVLQRTGDTEGAELARARDRRLLQRSSSSEEGRP